ncbi:hypothetical protein [Limosilactobacillus fermentum]|uniref:hypothetical protein n=1 Tax=Limosilactobacillus fermentum TaxID=1613 RepID=UPI001E5556BC|nr:hypothetical protein [Limosilactobacillus fermentum]MCD5422923.1 hypothetical protein [Limosilactobacillus fermentum]
MRIDDTKARLVDVKIEDNLDILLASFGLKGIIKSSLKASLVEEIIQSLTGDIMDNIDLFFEELEEYYISDPQFRQFRLGQIRKYIFEERGYVTAHMIKF